MKLLPTLFLGILLGSPIIYAQTPHSGVPPTAKSLLQPASAPRPAARTGAEPAVLAPVSVPAADNVFGEQQIGYTFYDLQTNSSMPNRLHVWDNGRVSAVWNQSLDAVGGFSDRGTGYNKSDQMREFPAPPENRVENVRAGFPAYDVTSNGNEWIVSHIGSAAPYRIRCSHKSSSAPNWLQNDLPNAPATETFGHLWPRIAAGGNDGLTIHIIALSTPVASADNNPAARIDGLDGQLRYWRSTDGGASWDIVDVPLPGIDSSQWLGVNADSYAIDADGETVAVLVTSLFNDALVIKSNDNGTTWAAPRIVHDFPLVRFGADEYLYTFEDIAASWDPDLVPNNDSLAILSTDETGNLFVDPVGRVHVAIPSLYIREDDLTDDQYTYYPGYNLGIIYWNDEMDDDEGLIAAYSPDLDGDSLWGNDASVIFAAGYGEAFSCTPTLGMDADGRLYITYTSNHELAFEEMTSQHYRQPFIVRSEPGDFAAWSVPEPVLQAGLVNDPIIVSLSEYYFPVMARQVDNEVHIQVQHDYEFGITLRATPVQPPSENTIEYIGFPTDLFTVGTNDVDAARVELAVMPNPVTDGRATLLFDLTAAAETRIEIYNVAGSLVHARSAGQLNAGHHQAALTVDGLNDGLYYVRVQSGNRSGVRKMVVLE